MEKILVIAGYVLIDFAVIVWIVRRSGREKITKFEFDSFYFLKIAFICATCSQLGFAILVSILYSQQHSVAVGLTALIAIPGLPIIALAIMRGFTVRFNSIPNLIRRLDRMTPDQQERLLASLPLEIFSRLPGDYRFVSKNVSHN